MSRDEWGKRPRKPKTKRDSWAKPKRGKRKKDFGSVSNADKRKAKKDAKKWGKPKGGAPGILAGFKSDVRSGGWLGRIIKRPRGIGLREYYRKFDESIAASREDVAQQYEADIQRAETVGQKLSRWAEGILRRRLSPGQAADVRDIAREVTTTNPVVAFVTNLFKGA